MRIQAESFAPLDSSFVNVSQIQSSLCEKPLEHLSNEFKTFLSKFKLQIAVHVWPD